MDFEGQSPDTHQGMKMSHGESHHHPQEKKRKQKLHPAVLIQYLLYLIVGSWVLGVLGYRFIAGLSWMEAIESASLILAGMGLPARMKTTQGKWFTSAYAIYSGIFFIVIVAAVLDKVIENRQSSAKFPLVLADPSSDSPPLPPPLPSPPPHPRRYRRENGA